MTLLPFALTVDLSYLLSFWMLKILQVFNTENLHLIIEQIYNGTKLLCLQLR